MVETRRIYIKPREEWGFALPERRANRGAPPPAGACASKVSVTLSSGVGPIVALPPPGGACASNKTHGKIRETVNRNRIV